MHNRWLQLLILGIVLTLRPTSAANAQYQVHIDWQWGNHGSPEYVCAADTYSDPQGRVTRRAGATPHQTVVNAIQAARQGDYRLANWWLATAQCHNGDARRAIENGGRSAVDYAVQRFGSQVPGGSPAPPSLPRAEILEYTNFTGQLLYVYEGLIPLGGILYCDAPGMQYKRTLADHATYRSAPAPAGYVLWVRIQERQTGACDSRYNRFEGKARPPS